MELIQHVRALRVLCEVADRGSFTAAAGALGVSQSAVTQHIASLERQTGTPLFQHGTRPMELTVAGNALADPALEGFPGLDLTRIPLLDDRFRIVVPRGHRLARRSTSLALTDLAREPWSPWSRP